MLLTAPLYASESINTRTKLGLTLFISVVIYPVCHTFLADIPNSMIEYGLMGIAEALIGITLGFCLTISFSVYQLAGQFFTVQMGFGASEVFDPMSQISLPLMGQYLNIMALLVFLSLHGPIIIIKEIFHSFELVSVNTFLHYSAIESQFGLIELFAKMFIIALRMSLPILGTLMIITVVMGLLGKAAPQMNLLMIGFPISITITFVVILLVIPGLVAFTRDYIDEMFKDIWFLMREFSSAK